MTQAYTTLFTAALLILGALIMQKSGATASRNSAEVEPADP